MREAERLRGTVGRFDRVHDLSPDQIVTWKPGLKNRDEPGLQQPVIVLELLDEPLDDEESSDCSAPWDRRDLIGGWLDDEGQLAIGCFDRRRLQPRIVIEEDTDDS